MGLKCELCGGTEFIKDEGNFVCQGCNTKYSLEEAKKMMGDTPNVGATATDKKLDNLYQLARQAREENNSENAGKYYDMIVIERPDDWEAKFYSVYYQSMQCKIAEIYSAASRVNNCEENVLKLIKENVKDPEEQKKAISDVQSDLAVIALMLFTAAKNHFYGIGASIRANYTQEYLNNGCAARNILYNFGDRVISMFGDEYQKEAVSSWIAAVEMHKSMMVYFADKEVNKNHIMSYVSKIQKYDSSYQTPTINTGGCYVATAVYGSYDCPEVWTLRRFRDDTLAKTWYGRMFIRVYYAVSPTLVKWFG
ncbi:MAG: CFI-box-CTERM domain-containing protein [Clostridia bacterium]|nr:CFI-box-CTERM domain-containing protein [Clostridia bacterium]